MRKKILALLSAITLAVGFAMAAEPQVGQGIVVGDTVVPGSDTYPVSSARFHYGGWHSVSNLTDMSNLVSYVRQPGMAVWVVDESCLYVLEGGSWTAFGGAGSLTTNSSPTMADGTLWTFYEAYRGTNAGSLFGNEEYVTYGKVVQMMELYSPDVLYVETNSHPVISGAGSLWDNLSGSLWSNNYSLAVGTTTLGTFFYTNDVDEVVPEGVYFGTLYADATTDGTVEMYFELIVSDGSTTNVLAASGMETIESAVQAHNTSAFNPTNWFVPGAGWYFGVKAYAVRTGGTSATLNTYGGMQAQNTRLFIPSLNPAETAWGSIGGNIQNQTDLWTQLTNRYTIAQSDSAYIRRDGTAPPTAIQNWNQQSLTNLGTEISFGASSLDIMPSGSGAPATRGGSISLSKNGAAYDGFVILRAGNGNSQVVIFDSTDTPRFGWDEAASILYASKPLQMGNNVITNLGSPTHSSHAVNLGYMTNYIAGLGHLTINSSPTMADGTAWVFDTMRARYEDYVLVTNNTQLTLSDGGKLYIVDATNDVVLSLPTNSSASSIGMDFKFVNLSTNLLIIDAPDGVSIEDSDPGAQMYSGEDQTNYWPWSSITLKQAESNWWHALAARGDWTTTGTNSTPVPTGRLPVGYDQMVSYVTGLGYLTTNSSPTMAGGTTWTFALANVTNNADTGTEIVNWQTMTNYVGGAGIPTWRQTLGVNPTSTVPAYIYMSGGDGLVLEAPLGPSQPPSVLFKFGTDLWRLTHTGGTQFELNHNTTNKFVFSQSQLSLWGGDGVTTYGRVDLKLNQLTKTSGGNWTVTTDATTGQEIVNWQTMTNWVAGGGRPSLQQVVEVGSNTTDSVYLSGPHVRIGGNAGTETWNSSTAGLGQLNQGKNSGTRYQGSVEGSVNAGSIQSGGLQWNNGTASHNWGFVRDGGVQSIWGAASLNAGYLQTSGPNSQTNAGSSCWNVGFLQDGGHQYIGSGSACLNWGNLQASQGWSYQYIGPNIRGSWNVGANNTNLHNFAYNFGVGIHSLDTNSVAARLFYSMDDATNGYQVVNWQTMTNHTYSTFLTTNSSPTMADGTTWVFAKMRYLQEDYYVITNDTQLTIDDGGKAYIVRGTNEVVVSLPTNSSVLSMGMDFTFVNLTTNILTIDAPSTFYIDDSDLDGQIYSGINGTNDWPWSSIKLKQADSNWWHVLHARGDWTTTGTNTSAVPPPVRGIGGLFTMVGGVTNQTVSYGATYTVDMWPTVTPTSDATFQAVPEIVSWSRSNFVFRIRGAASFVTNSWRVVWNAAPSP